MLPILSSKPTTTSLYWSAKSPVCWYILNYCHHTSILTNYAIGFSCQEPRGLRNKKEEKDRPSCARIAGFVVVRTSRTSCRLKKSLIYITQENKRSTISLLKKMSITLYHLFLLLLPHQLPTLLLLLLLPPHQHSMILQLVLPHHLLHVPVNLLSLLIFVLMTITTIFQLQLTMMTYLKSLSYNNNIF